MYVCEREREKVRMRCVLFSESWATRDVVPSFVLIYCESEYVVYVTLIVRVFMAQGRVLASRVVRTARKNVI